MNYWMPNRKLSNLKRRDFLKMAGVGGLALAVPLIGSGLLSNKTSWGKGSTPFTTTFDAMGTIVQIIIDDPISNDKSNLAVSAISEEVMRLESVLTRFPGGADLCMLNQTDCVESPSADLLSVLKSATSNSEVSEGSFDVTVKPVLDMLQAYLEGQPFPTDAQFEKARNLINYEQVAVTSSLVTLNKPGMGVTLDGIATGYILDQSVRVMKSNGIRSALINFGGTLATIGARADGSRWKVGIVDPLSPTNTMGYLYLKDQAVATSGDYEDYYTTDKNYYHIIDPFTARSPLYSHSATVVSSTAMVADPLGVSLMVDSPESAIKLADSYPAECLISSRSNGVLMTSGMKEIMAP